MSEEATIFVPARGSPLERTLAPQSGIVGRYRGKLLHIYYEGNLYGAVNLKTWSERVRCAAGRLFCRYPTVAQQAVFDETNLVAVGVIRAEHERAHYEIEIFEAQQGALDAWLSR